MHLISISILQFAKFSPEIGRQLAWNNRGRRRCSERGKQGRKWEDKELEEESEEAH